MNGLSDRFEVEFYNILPIEIRSNRDRIVEIENYKILLILIIISHLFRRTHNACVKLYGQIQIPILFYMN